MKPVLIKSDNSISDLALQKISGALDQYGFIHLESVEVLQILSQIVLSQVGDDESFLESWNTLEQDQYMADGGRYRKRRHATFATHHAGDQPVLMPHQPHYQTVDYNPLNGGVARYFEPVLEDLLKSQTLRALLDFGNNLFSQISGNYRWHIELHQFRIEARDGQKGNPTPEGVHRDGVDYVIVMMINRVNINSGATTIYDLENQLVGEFTLLNAFDMVIVNDRKVYHGVTPIDQIDPNSEAYRDVLVMTFKIKQ